MDEAAALRRGLPTLTLLAAITPLLGLLGTVTGMIATFDSIAVFGNHNVRGMASGISRALVTTLAGLLTALSRRTHAESISVWAESMRRCPR